MGSLLPTDGHRPKFAQLYIYDTENEVTNRITALDANGNLESIDRSIVAELIEMFDNHNEIVKAFRMARDHFIHTDFLPLRLRLIGARSGTLEQYNPPSCAEIAGLIVGDLGSVDRQRDIIVEHKTEGLKHISDLHPSFIAMQYPILFPYGRKATIYQKESGYLRSEIYQGIRDAVVEGDIDGNAIGKRIILPSSFTAGSRYMIQNYQDAIAICRHCGPPDLFITFTCNAQWPEIRAASEFIPGQKAEDRPDIVSRMFKLKLEALMEDIKKRRYFGKSVAELYTVEFQKRGLPHVHMLIWLQTEHKYSTTTEINAIILAEIPDQVIMIQLAMQLLQNLWRRNTNLYVLKAGIELDNRFVVPYNLQLLIKYQAHINVEWCNKSRLIKYLFKYINKSPDRSAVVIENNVTYDISNLRRQYKHVDEIKQYLDCRYLSAYEAVWRLFEFDIHFRQPSVERLGVHLPMMNNVTYHGSQNLINVVNRPNIEKTMFTEWMHTNLAYDDARQLTYAEFPTQWVWHSTDKFWSRRKRGYHIGRIIYIHPNAGELYFLRMLLNVVKGPRSYVEIRTVNGVTYDTFRSACDAFGLLGDDKEWREAFEEASHWSGSVELRQLFATLVIYCEVADPLKLWDEFWTLMADDILYRLKRALGVVNLQIPQIELQNHVLFELEVLFNKNNCSLSQYNLPIPNRSIFGELNNRLLAEELDYNRDELLQEYIGLFGGLNNEQRIVYNTVLAAVYQNTGDIIFVYGHGGTGKTYLWKTIITKLRSEGRIVLAVASSGIASLLLPGGRTAHSRFKIPIRVDDCSTCEIKKGTQLANLITQAALIIWDEAPMNHRNCFEALDKSLKDISETNGSSVCDKLFGGKTVVFGGDFRQILPVIVGGTKQDILNASLPRSYIWSKCKVFRLTTNMRLLRGSMNNTIDTSLAEFSQWVLDIGDGKINSVKLDGEEEPSWIKIPDDMLIKASQNSIETIISEIYDNIGENYNNPDYLRDRAIITPRNESVDEVNNYVLSMVQTEEQLYLSSDSICASSKNAEENNILYPVDFLNSLKFNGVPDHKLLLKIGTPIMLLRNINQNSGLCNGTRLIITQLAPRVIEAQIFTGNHIGEKVYIPRIVMNVTESKWPFVLKRRQFPVRVSYAMTINKSQGQTLKKVGLYLSHPVFSHGQLYVAVSRVTSRKGLRILLKHKDKEPEGPMENVLLSQLTLYQKECRIKVRICRLWQSTAPFLKGDIFSLECLLVDEKGFPMQATIRKQDAEEFQCRIIEGAVYLIEKFSVIPNVIGKLSAVSEITHRYIGQTLTPIRNLEIQDLYKNTLSVTLWDKFAADFDEKLISGEGTKSSVIIILAGMTVRTFKG
ncbi:uncharacterized protein LOC109720334 [Ananas comosus]|uniref:ATP-dependent DNA helicase n=1 Tax=Ananas comosus TaxID=4615 RepID=A0A6P5G540_ANACO|nr:uncharacterized protein LOC109720334 [Ananas comosus]